jgi:tetratricopeptide (TPR) repeat protein
MARQKKPGSRSKILAFPQSRPPEDDVEIPPDLERVLERILFGKPFKTLKEANTFFSELRGELLEMFDMAGGDPDSPEGLIARARQEQNDDEAEELLGRAVDIARAELGDNFFASPAAAEDLPEAAMFWLEAKLLLAERARLQGAAKESVRHFEDIYRFMPDSEIEHGLVAGYLATGKADAAKTLLDRAEPSVSTWFALALCEFLRKQKPAAALALQRALKANRHLREYLTGKRKLPAAPEFSDVAGSRGEADQCMFRLIPAWTAHPAALDWLSEQVSR